MLPRKDVDLSRASSTYSTYSTDSNRRYVDSRSNAEMNSKSSSFQAAREYAESLASSTASLRDPAKASAPTPTLAPLQTTTSRPSTTHSRPSTTSSRHSSRPSFMNYVRPESPAPTPPIAVPQTAGPGNRTSVATVKDASDTAPTPASGLLLLFLAAEVPAEMAQYLDVACKKHSYSGIVVVGLQERETAIKQLKMDIYGMIGKMGRNVSVQTHLMGVIGEEDVTKALQQTVSSGEEVRTVICSPSFGFAQAKVADILSLEEDELMNSYILSAGYLHAIAKATMPRLLEGTTKSAPGQFLVVETAGSSPAESVNLAACEMLLRQLSIAYAPRGLKVDYAANVLVPEPEREREKSNGDVAPPTNGYTTPEPEFTPSESPTKLWNMWALANDRFGG